MTSSNTQPELHSSPSLFPPVVLTQPCISSSSAAACIAIENSYFGYSGQQSELHSLPPPCPLSSPTLCFSESGSASVSMSMIPTYQQIQQVPMLEGSSLHARGISQSSFNASGNNMISVDLSVPPVVSSPFAALLSSLDSQLQQEVEAQPVSTTSADMLLGRTEKFFGLAMSTSTSSKQPLSFVSSFGDPMHGVPFSDLKEAPAVPQSHRIARFRKSTLELQASQQAKTRSSPWSAGLPPRWRPPRSRIDDTTTTTIGHVKPCPDLKLPPLPPSLQTPPTPPVEQVPTGSEMPGQDACHRSSSMDCSKVSMPNLSIGASDSSGKLFTDTEMEKIRKEKHLSHLMKTDPKRVKRLLSNRESAKKSKERKEKHIVGLEHRLKVLEMERETLSKQTKLQQEALAEMTSENRMLSIRLQGSDQELKLKEELNEALRSRVNNLKHANLSSSSSLHQEMSLVGGQCSNSGLHQDMRK